MINFEGLKSTLCAMNGNVTEASEKIRMAHGLKAEHKVLADWQKEMAIAHLGFNASGQKAIMSMMNDIKSDPEYDEFAKGKMCAYEEWMNDILVETTNVQSIITSYK